MVTFQDFLNLHAEEILKISRCEGFVFEVRALSNDNICVKCILPSSKTRYITFEDHRVNNNHGEVPHVCNQWYKGLGAPLSFVTGVIVTDENKIHRAELAASIMCMTQSDAYSEIKNLTFG